jgi:hypothetical protein
VVPKRDKEGASLGWWVSTQRKHHYKNKLGLDRKTILDEIGFAWKDDDAHHNYDDKLWHQQHEKLVKFKQNRGHCKVPQRNKRFWTKLGSLGKVTTSYDATKRLTRSSGTSSMKRLSTSNKTMAIV